MELPLRALVAAIVASVTIPAIIHGLNSYEFEQTSVRLARAIEAVAAVAQQFYVSGGGAEDVRADFGNGLSLRVEYVEIGDTPGGARGPTARYKVLGQPEVFLITDPPVPMTAGDGPLRLGAGQYTVRVSYGGEGPVRLVVRG